MTFGDNGKGRIIEHGSIGNNSSSLMENVLLVDGLKHNLLSISQLCDKGFKVIFESSHCIIKDSQNDKIIFMGHRNEMFILLIFQNMKAIIDVFLACMMRVGCVLIRKPEHIYIQVHDVITQGLLSNPWQQYHKTC